MALPDLTGQNIQDTYQRLLQVSGTLQVTDGTGSLVPLLEVTASHAVSASHEITFELSSSHADSADSADSLTTGIDISVRHITASGNISASGTISAGIGTSKILGALQLGSGLQNITDGEDYITFSANQVVEIGDPSGAVNGTVFKVDDSKTSFEFNDGHITASGDISASGTIHADSYVVDGYLALNTDGSTQGRVFSDANITGIQIGRNGSPTKNIELLGPVTASGNISSSGDILATNFRVPGTLASTGYYIDALSTSKPTINANSNVLILGAKHSSYTGQGVKIFSSGSGEGLKMDALGNITASGNISSSGAVLGFTGSFTHLNSSDRFYINNKEVLDDSGTTLGINEEGDFTGVQINRPNNPMPVMLSGNTTASGDISASGQIIGSKLFIDATSAGGIIFDDDGDQTAEGSLTFINNGVNIFAHSANPSTATHLYVTQSGGTGMGFGKVGINTLTPNKALEVVGGISASGTITGGGLDINGTTTFNDGNITNVGGISLDLIQDEGENGTSINMNPTSINVNVNEVMDVLVVGLGGHITASGNISSSGNVTTTFVDAKVSGTGYKLSGAKALYTHDNSTVVGRTGRLTLTGSSARFGLPGNNMHVTASGDISSSGDILASTYKSHGTNALAFSSDSIKVSETYPIILNHTSTTATNITASGNISSSGAISSSLGFFTPSIVKAEQITSTDDITAAGTIQGEHISSTDDIVATDDISAGGNMEAGAAGNFGFAGSLQLARVNSSTELYIGVSNTWTKFQIGKNTDQPVTFVGHITASGNVSASRVSTISSGTGSFHYLKGDTTSAGTGLTVEGFIEGINITGSNISASGTTNSQLYHINGKTLAVDSSNNLRIGEATFDSIDINNSDVAIGGSTGDIRLRHVTASGNISASGDVHGIVHYGQNFQPLPGNSTFAIGTTSTSTQDFSLTIGHHTNSAPVTIHSNITASGDISASAFLDGNRKFTSEPTEIDGLGPKGDIVYFGGGSVSQGRVYYWNSSGNWTVADHESEEDATGFLAYALGNSVAADGMLIRGFVMTSGDLGDPGSPLYLGQSNGVMSTTRPTAAGTFVRIMGYCLDNTSIMWFDPDKTWVELK